MVIFFFNSICFCLAILIISLNILSSYLFKSFIELKVQFIPDPVLLLLILISNVLFKSLLILFCSKLLIVSINSLLNDSILLSKLLFILFIRLLFIELFNIVLDLLLMLVTTIDGTLSSSGKLSSNKISEFELLRGWNEVFLGIFKKKNHLNYLQI